MMTYTNEDIYNFNYSLYALSNIEADIRSLEIQYRIIANAYTLQKDASSYTSQCNSLLSKIDQIYKDYEFLKARTIFSKNNILQDNIRISARLQDLNSHITQTLRIFK